jgi:ribonucleoside-triphosphate reductase
MNQETNGKCGKDCQVFSRVVGYFRPVQTWNDGKREEFKDRLEYVENKSIRSAEAMKKAA